jgi:hypothetical protein
MDRSTFADKLLNAVVTAVNDFYCVHGDETPYAFALIAGQAGNYLGYAVATEEALLRTADAYAKKGYRYRGPEWQVIDNRSVLAKWLRWGNPDDGWYYEDFAEQFQVVASLGELFSSGELTDGDGCFEQFCTEVLEALNGFSAWEELSGSRDLIVGFTSGEDSYDFLRTATRVNPYSKVLTLWSQFWEAQELDRRISAP